MHIHKRNKIWYYIRSYWQTCSPQKNAQRKIAQLTQQLSPEDLAKVHDRVAYYNQLPSGQQQPIAQDFGVKDLRKPKNPKAYYFDTFAYAKYFAPELKMAVCFGDVDRLPTQASILKSRPITADNQLAVLLNLDKVRHFVFVEDEIPYGQKKDMMIGRAAVFQQHRVDFYQQYFDHPLCDLGQVNPRGGNPELWLKPKIGLAEHLQYKFVLSLQGNDVATNLKWIMSSNSIAVMPKPTIETWFMEGSLQAGVHYIEILPDYSNLQSQLAYYLQHPEEAQQIIQNANAYVQQFQNPIIEDLCALLVLQKYFECT
jgi:Glycosyl transferase family 90